MHWFEGFMWGWLSYMTDAVAAVCLVILVIAAWRMMCTLGARVEAWYERGD